MNDQPWRHNQRPNNSYNRQQNFRAPYDYGNIRPGNLYARPRTDNSFASFRPTEQMHPAFRPDFNSRQRVHNEGSMNDSSQSYPVGQPGFTGRPNRYTASEGQNARQVEFRSPRQVPRPFRFQQNFGQQKNWNTHQPNSNKVLKESSS